VFDIRSESYDPVYGRFNLTNYSRGVVQMTLTKRRAVLLLISSAGSALSFGGLLIHSEAALGSEVSIQGEVLGRGAPCVQFRMDNGETVSLEGASPQSFKSGMKLKLLGNWMRISTCMQGRAFRVSHSEDIQ
jgi:hypothetical protein